MTALFELDTILNIKPQRVFMKRLEQIQTKDYIASAIRNEILAGHMQAGEELTQEELAEVLGVSRMPVREALQTLVQEGFVERLPNRHMQVVALDPAQIRETFCVIASMEAMMANIIMENGSETSELLQICNRMAEEKNEEKLGEMEIELHHVLASLSKNKYLKQLHGNLINGYVSYAILNLGKKSEVIPMVLTIWKMILEKDEAGNAEAFQRYYAYYAEKFQQAGE